MSSAGNLRRDADELLRLAMLTESLNVKRILTSEATKLVQVAESEEKADVKSEVTPKNSPTGLVTRPTFTNTKLYNYGWDQSEKFLKIYVTVDGVKGLNAECVNCHFEEKSFDLQVLDAQKKVNYVLTVKNLLHVTIPSESYFKVKPDMVILFIRKTSSQKWGCVTEAEKRAKDAKAPKFDNNKEEDPGASLMTLMKQMYDDGDDDMKRTIAKAWTEARDKKSPEEMM